MRCKGEEKKDTSLLAPFPAEGGRGSLENAEKRGEGGQGGGKQGSKLRTEKGREKSPEAGVPEKLEYDVNPLHIFTSLLGSLSEPGFMAPSCLGNAVWWGCSRREHRAPHGQSTEHHTLEHRPRKGISRAREAAGSGTALPFRDDGSRWTLGLGTWQVPCGRDVEPSQS